VWEVEPVGPGPTEVRVKVLASGVCRSDHHRITGAIPAVLPQILGHEACAVVLEAGSDVRALQPGDRVVASPNPECGRCWYCVHGQPNLCVTTDAIRARVVAHGAGREGITAIAGLGSFADEMTVDETMLVKVETGLPDDLLALLGCAVITGVGAVLNTARVTAGSTVAVIGCGGVGLACIQGSRIAGASRIFAIDPVEAKRELARRLGATDAIDVATEDPSAAIRSATDGRGADYTFEAVGSARTILLARSLARRGGTTVLVGAAPKSETVTFNAWDLHTEGRILGCSNGSAHVHRDIPRLIELAEKGELQLADMVTRRVGLDGLATAFDDMEAGAGVRTVVVPAG
jgi:S-(hydroxymethyl)glutathione dehydrogenase / alcohol dehydrogenase